MINHASQSSLLIAALLGISAIAVAQTPDPEGYLLDTRGAVVKSGFGLCWKTTRWTPAMAIAECDPDLVKKEAVKLAEKTEAPPPQPAAVKVTLAADALFDFDKAVLRPEGKAKLDDVAAKVKGIKLEAIIIVGHTDRIGSDKYNQNLSERRGAAVKDYLAAKGVEPGRLYAEGKGKTQPVTGDKCGKSVKKSKKLIECLQPDRRVEIEIIGTQQAK